MPDTSVSIVVPGNRITLLDIVKKNGSDGVVGLVDETVRNTPEVLLGAARTIKGLNYKTLIRTSLGTVQFRDHNSASQVIKSTYKNQLIETFLVNPRIEADKAAADSDEDGAEAYLAMEASGVMDSTLQTLGRTFYYGRNTTFGGDAKGNPGIIDYVDSALTLDAGGTTDNTASSVWFVAFGQKMVQWVFGLNGQLSMEPTRLGDIVTADGGRVTGYISELLARPGLQVLNKYSVVRIKKLTADAGKTLTDAKLGSALALLPAAFRGVMKANGTIFMHTRSLEQLRASRTATNITGAPAPTPNEYEGIPIIPTDSLSVTETLAL